MKRRNFIERLVLSGGIITSQKLDFSSQKYPEGLQNQSLTYLSADVIVVGAGLGGIAASLSLLRNGLKVLLTEETDWIGGQLTQQGVPADEHSGIETHGAPKSYRELRDLIRNYYKQNYPLTDIARKNAFLNPGNGTVSRLCHEPKAAISVLNGMLAQYISNGQLTLLLEHKVTSADADERQVNSVSVEDRKNGCVKILKAPYFIDATELGDLLPLTGTDYIVGTESRSQTGELHAPEVADPQSQQAFTTCFALDYIEGEDFVDKPENYSFWEKYVPAIEPAWSGRLLDLSYSDPRTLKPKELGFDPTGAPTGSKLNLWNYRRIIDKTNFEPGFFKGDISLINWPQNDYMLGNLVDVSDREFQQHVEQSKQLGLSLLYWLQTEAPRPDGGKGWRGLRLRKDIMGSDDGFAKHPYVRESRRIKAEFTILEEHVGRENRALVAPQKSLDRAANFFDSVGVGYYHIDLHPTSKVNYVDFPSLKFQIPLGALLPVKKDNLLPANKNIGTTHITNGCYRLHPVEWSIGEAVGLLLVYAKDRNVLPRDVRRDVNLLNQFQKFLHAEGVETEWKE